MRAQAAFDFLAATPGAGPRVEPSVDAIPDLRFWSLAGFRSYLVLYRPIGDGVEILRVIHGARDIGSIMSRG